MEGVDSNIERLLTMVQAGIFPTAENLAAFNILKLNNNTERLILALSILIGNLAGSIPLRTVTNNGTLNEIIADGFEKGLLIVDAYTDENGNVGNAMILVLAGQKYLVPSLPLP